MKNTTPYYETMHLSGNEVNAYINHSNGNYYVSHWHDAVEMIYISSGDLTVSIAGVDYELKDDSFILINSKVIHSTHCFVENEAFVLQIPEDFIKQSMPNQSHILFELPFRQETANNPQMEQIKGIIREMFILYQSWPEGAKMKFYSLLYELLFGLYCNFRVELPKETAMKYTKNLSIIRKVMSYSEEKHAASISIQEIAGVAGLQPKYFCRFFKENVGNTYLNYLNELRISYIHQELLSTDLPLYQILDKHGFTNYKLFRKLFNERFHDTPGRIRKLYLRTDS